MEATTREQFDKDTSLDLYFLINDVIDRAEHYLFNDQLEWFVKHAEWRIRFMHATKNSWKKWLEGKNRGIDQRSQCQVWIIHWFTAFCKDPEIYIERHSS